MRCFPLARWLVLLPLVGASAFGATVDASVRTSAGNPLENAVVVLEPLSVAPAKRRRTVTIEQKDREFLPYVTVVETGTLVEFPNRDPFKHHIYSFSPAKVFEIKLYADKPVLPVLFDKAGEVALGCNIHDWMEAYVLVVNTPHFGKTGVNGNTTIRDLVPGRYHLRVWHPQQQTEAPQREIEIVAGTAPQHLNLQAKVLPRTPKPKPPLDADKY